MFIKFHQLVACPKVESNSITCIVESWTFKLNDDSTRVKIGDVQILKVLYIQWYVADILLLFESSKFDQLATCANGVIKIASESNTCMVVQ